MSNKATLSILQYNMRNERVTTMIPLLADPKLQDYNVVAIQEPWKNLFGATTLSFHCSGFHLLYKPRGNTQVCLYINERIDPDSWEIEYGSADICTLKIKIQNNNVKSLIYIYNVYNPFPTSYSSTESPSTFLEVEHALNVDAKHILLGDFNLHHPYWSGPSRPTQHAAVNQLLDIISKADIELTLPPSTITWEACQSYSIIDLIFLSAELIPKLEYCKTISELEQSLDHISMSTKLLLQCKATMIQPCRAWKMMDMKKLKKVLKQAPVPQALQTIANINTEIEKIQSFLCKVVDETIPWAKPSDWAKLFWDRKCDSAIKETYKLQKHWSQTQAFEN